MKKLIVSLILICPVFVPTLEATEIQVGERIRFQVKYGIFDAGTSIMEVEAIDTTHGHITYRLHSNTRSNKFIDAFYKVRDHMTSWIDTLSLATVQFEKSLNEGKYNKDYSVWFDYNEMQAVSSDTTIAIEDEMQDVLSLFYYIRSFDLSVGDTIRMSSFDNDEISPFWLAVKDIEKVKVPAGEYECLVVEPFLESDFLFKYEGGLTIWFTNDERNIPVLMKSKASIGSMILRLESYREGEEPPVSQVSSENAATQSGVISQ